mgnify:CR=1 FL=1
MLKKCAKVFRINFKTLILQSSIRHKTNNQNMKNLITYFTPRNADERNALGGLFVGILILTLIITLIP